MLLTLYRHWLCILLLLASFSALAQNSKADSIRIAISQAPFSKKASLYKDLVTELTGTNLPQARAAGFEMLQYAISHNDSASQITALKLLFNISTVAGDYEEANELLKRLGKYIIGSNQPQLEVVLTEGAARIALEKGEYTKSIELYQEAIKHNERYKKDYPQLHDNLVRDYVNYSIALLSWAYTQRLEQALDTAEEKQTYRQCSSYFHLALGYRLAEKNTEEIINIYSNLTSLSHVLGRCDSAYYYANKAIELARAENNSDYRAYSNSTLAQLLMEDGEYTQALQQADKALELYQQIKNQKNIGTTLLLKGRIYKSAAKYSEAVEVSKRALPLLLAAESNAGIADVYLLLSDLYEQEGKHKDALESFRNYNLYKGKVIDEETAKEVAWIKGKFESENKAKQISELQRDNESSSNAVQRSYALLIIAALLLLFMITLLAVFRMRMRAQKIKARISEQELLAKLKEEELTSISKILESREAERKRIANDLHDRLGVMLATSSMLIEKSIMDGYTSALLDNSLSINRDASDEVRRVSQELSSPVLQRFGLGPAINELANSINSTGKFYVHLSGMSIQLDNADVELNLYRIIQELINNTIKHSGGNSINIEGVQREQEMLIIYKDNGKGIDTSIDWKGIGWKSMESRMQHIGGIIEVDVNVVQGITILIKLPFEK